MLKLKPSTVSKEAFLAAYGNIYEHSPWIAEATWNAKMGENLDAPEALHAAMKQAVELGTEAQQLALICAHPDLACAQGELTAASTSEQTGAGLKQCTAEEFAAFQQLNRDYKAKFGFPFIVAVKGLHRTQILEQFRARIHHTRDEEFRMALTQIHKIALFRLQALAEETVSS